MAQLLRALSLTRLLRGSSRASVPDESSAPALLLESGDYLLLETGGRILLEAD